MKRIIYKSVVSTVVVLMWLLSLQTVNAQTADNSNKIHGAFAYIQHDPDYAGWQPCEDYKQHSCKRCYKTITTQLFVKPDGKKVVLYSSLECNSSPDGKHEIAAQPPVVAENTTDGNTKPQNNINTSSKPGDKTMEQSKDEDKSVMQDNDEYGQDSNEKGSQPADPEPKPELIFSIDSLFIDNYLSFYYTANSLSQNTSVQVVVKIDNASKTNHIYEEKITLVMAPGTNYFIIKPGMALNDVIKKGYIVSIYCTGESANGVKSYSSDIKDGKKGVFKIYF